MATLDIGEKVPGFTLPGADGRSVEFVPGESVAVVVFTCNHCPYARAWHERLNDVARDYAGKGIEFLQINSNDVSRSPGDSLEAMAAAWPLESLLDRTCTTKAKTLPALLAPP